MSRVEKIPGHQHPPISPDELLRRAHCAVQPPSTVTVLPVT